MPYVVLVVCYHLRTAEPVQVTALRIAVRLNNVWLISYVAVIAYTCGTVLRVHPIYYDMLCKHSLKA
jgi:hypothetical protein